jgi:HEXXH motif-containing protein
MLWGGMFINAARRRTPLELLEVLVHESAHLLLYAFTQHEPLVLNDEAERYTSPLRTDPRPMEGIYHATWVSARMTYAMHKLSCSKNLDAELRHQALAAANADLANFAAGHALVKAHGRLTDTGRRVIDEAAAAMEAIGLSALAEP